MEQSHQPMEQPSAPKQTSTGLEPNLAAALSYLCWFVTGLIFFLMERENKFVRFHAMQSIVTSAAFIILSIGMMIIGMIPFIGTILSLLMSIVLGLGGFILWILMMIKAYQGERFKLPVVGDFAEKHSA